jgi:hypothetical protein
MQSDSPNQEELIKLEAYLNKIPQYMFLPSFAGVPKPEVFLNKFKSKTGNTIYWCHSGLADTISDWCKKNNIQITGIDDNLKYRNVPETLDEFTKYVDSWQMSITPRPYQYKAAYEILKNRQSKAVRPAPLFDHGLSLVCGCRNDEEVKSFDPAADLPVQSFVGSHSAYDNLRLIPENCKLRLRRLEERDREVLFSGLEDALPEIYRDKIWEMIWKRWCAYESM